MTSSSLIRKGGKRPAMVRRVSRWMRSKRQPGARNGFCSWRKLRPCCCRAAESSVAGRMESAQVPRVWRRGARLNASRPDGTASIIAALGAGSIGWPPAAVGNTRPLHERSALFDATGGQCSSGRSRGTQRPNDVVPFIGGNDHGEPTIRNLSSSDCLSSRLCRLAQSRRAASTRDRLQQRSEGRAGILNP